MPHKLRALRHPAAWALVLAAALLLPACGGGGTGTDGSGQNLVLVGFLQAGVDNAPLNTVLEFTFSEPVDPASVSQGAMQIREGPDFGKTARGEFAVEGSKVYFYPELPVDCELTTAGFGPGTTYRITVAGWPETYCIQNTEGQPLDRTTTYEFITLPETAAGLLQDQIPAQAPYVVSTMPANAEAAVSVAQGSEIVVEFSENLDPCTVTAGSVVFQVFERGDPDLGNAVEAPNGNMSGFNPATDSAPDDDYSWGAQNSMPVDPPQTIPANIELVQSIESTHMFIRPQFGEFPDNALIVLELTFAIRDFGGDPLPQTSLKFTTENRPAQQYEFTVEFDDTTPIDPAFTTADVNSARSPSRAQGWLLFAGDGDNGTSPSLVSPPPTFPIVPNANCEYRDNFGQKTAFDPNQSMTLNTGASRNTVCMNRTDGSTAVVWEFASIRIRSGVTVRIIGENPAILLSQGDVVIESGGTLLVRGDGVGGSPNGRGGNGIGYAYQQTTTGGKGGTAVAAAGDGGNANAGSKRSGDDGYVGIGSPDYGIKEQGGLGAGQGNVSSSSSTYGQNGTGGAPSGGGGGHAVEGMDGTALLSNTSWKLDGDERGAGGGIYPTESDAEKLYTPSAGSGGGGGGGAMNASTYYEAPGGGGGAGGGFVDITSGGDIRIYGSIDAAGSRGGNGGASYYAGGGGGGGGSGGGIRLLTPNDIDLTGGTLTSVGGSGGTGSGGSGSYYTPGPRNNGGSGGHGRIVLEDGDSIITGLVSAMVLPGEGMDGFYRGNFQATRFQGGGLDSTATTELMFLGPITPPQFDAPQLADFGVGIPADVSMGNGKTSILVEVQGYPLLPDGTADLSQPTGWWTAGHFISTVSGPALVEGENPTDVPVPSDNVGAGMENIDGSCYVQVRLRFWLPNGTTPSQPGPYVDRWTMRFAYDQ